MQGVAEVVPISSSAQLTVVPLLLGWPAADERTLSAALLHAGSCVGIGWALREELAALSTRELAVLAASSAPAALAGLLGGDVVERRLGRAEQLPALLAGVGALMLAVERWAARRHPVPRSRVHRRATASAALAQPLALLPGVSRAGAVRTALRVYGIDTEVAQRYSLLMSLPVTAGAAGLTLLQALRGGASPDLLVRAAPGVLTAVLSSVAATRLVRDRAGPTFLVASLYRLGVAAVLAARLREADP